MNNKYSYYKLAYYMCICNATQRNATQRNANANTILFYKGFYHFNQKYFSYIP